MTKGLITRIGEWLDSKWESKVTQSQLDASMLALETQMDANGKALDDGIKIVLKKVTDELEIVKGNLNHLIETRNDDLLNKEVTDLKARIEKMELYSGLKRSVPGTKTPIEKSAFAM